MEMEEFCHVGSCHGKFSTFVRCRFLSLETRQSSVDPNMHKRHDANMYKYP